MFLFNSTRAKMAKVFLLSMLSFPAFAEPPMRNTLTIGLSQYPSTFHPLFDAMVAKSYILGMAQRPLTIYDADWKLICALCTDVPTYDNGRAEKWIKPDGKTGIAATYTIRPDAVWGDGVPVTSKDIVFAWEVGKHPDAGVDNRAFFAEDIADIKIIDDKSFTVFFAREACDFAALGDFYPLPEHLERAIFEEDPKTYRNRTLYVTAPPTPGLYWGPYLVTQTENGAAVTLQKNSNWKSPTPSFEKITVRTIENSAALSANLLSGDIDYIAGELGLLLDQAISFEKRLQSTNPDEYTVIYKPGLTYEHIDFRLDHAVWKDLRVRQALLLGMDREKISKRIFGGKQEVATTGINPLDTVYNKNVKTYGYDPVQAGILLDAAGWRKGPDGKRLNEYGGKLTVVLSTTAGNKSRELIQQAIQSDWRAIGIDARIENQPARVLFGETLQKRKYDGGVMYAWMSAPRNIPKTTLHSSMIPAEKNNHAGQNYTGYNNPKMDEIIEDLEVVCAPEENQKLWNDLQSLYAEELPALPLYYRADAFFIPKWLTGIVPTGHMHPTTLFVESWGVAK